MAITHLSPNPPKRCALALIPRLMPKGGRTAGSCLPEHQRMPSPWLVGSYRPRLRSGPDGTSHHAEPNAMPSTTGPRLRAHHANRRRPTPQHVLAAGGLPHTGQLLPGGLAGKPLAGFCTTPSRRIQEPIITSVIDVKKITACGESRFPARFLAVRIGADLRYSGLMTKNPLNPRPNCTAQWFRRAPYTLSEQREWLPDEIPKPILTSGVGRHRSTGQPVSRQAHPIPQVPIPQPPVRQAAAWWAKQPRPVNHRSPMDKKQRTRILQRPLFLFTKPRI